MSSHPSPFLEGEKGGNFSVVPQKVKRHVIISFHPPAQLSPATFLNPDFLNIYIFIIITIKITQQINSRLEAGIVNCSFYLHDAGRNISFGSCHFLTGLIPNSTLSISLVSFPHFFSPTHPGNIYIYIYVHACNFFVSLEKSGTRVRRGVANDL